MKNLRWKTILRLDTIQRHFRIGRLAWERGIVGDGDGYSVKLAFGLWPRLFRWQRDARCDTLICIMGLRIHYSRSYGGRYA
jgi:hypothetical protein